MLRIERVCIQKVYDLLISFEQAKGKNNEGRGVRDEYSNERG